MKEPEAWDAVSSKEIYIPVWETMGEKMRLTILLQPNQSAFFIFRKPTKEFRKGKDEKLTDIGYSFDKDWTISFPSSNQSNVKDIKLSSLHSWTTLNDSTLKYFSGTVTYKNTFTGNEKFNSKNLFISFDSIYNILTIKINGINCGTIWTQPYELDITKAVIAGENKIEIEVTNTWHNRLIGDNLLPPDKRVTWTTAPFRLKDKPLLPAGLVGDVKLIFR